DYYCLIWDNNAWLF
nr:immunoglobulin light chain junction region [Macaca mulatta]MOX78198.1 immunoglobulin light chain junction region [Macaca mulatta]MOX78400.1 immunoglobulin light chain junction region [Macaca mulatta]MOX80073.1 immunoglobulin light chain junction region [Macaca mulatta]MOX80417.1 immunoglobulin light chain junction region [Macaca mulatta]